jgi:very-short-patch-repair endonuclease
MFTAAFTPWSAVLACGAGTYVSHDSAAGMWGFRPPVNESVHITAVGRRSESRAGIRVHRVRSIDDRDTRRHSGLPITSPARTLLDIACDLSARELERAFDEAIASRLMTLAAARAAVLANGDRRGAARMRMLTSAERTTTMTRSEAEEMLLALVDQARLPRPEVNTRVGRFEVDFCWRSARIVVEVDGYAFHSSRAALERDHRRDAELQQLGFLVIRITWRELRFEPMTVVASVAGALGGVRASAGSARS